MPNGNHKLRDMLGFPFTKDRYASYARGVIGEPNHCASEGRYSGWFEKKLAILGPNMCESCAWLWL